MRLPDYWMSRPQINLDESTRSAFEALMISILSCGEKTTGREIPLLEYDFTAPRWQFLCYLADTHQVVLHGTGNPNISEFEPRQSNDLNEFGNRKAVYATGDGIWAMFFAIVDRDRYSLSVSNACIRVVDAFGFISEPYYVFSVSKSVRHLQPWRAGYVYLLPAETFVAQPDFPFGEYKIRVPQLASPVPVTPLARLEVMAEDFPFLAQIRGHDDERLQEYADAMQTGRPWPDG